MPTMLPVIAIEDAAREFGVSRDTLDRLAAKGTIDKHRRFGDRKVYVDREEVKAALGFRRIKKD